MITVTLASRWAEASNQQVRILIFHNWEQEISEALAGQMSNEDEDEVEDELERLEQETVVLPRVPSQVLGHEVVHDMADGIVAEHDLPDVPTSIAAHDPERLQKQRERAKARKIALHA